RRRRRSSASAYSAYARRSARCAQGSGEPWRSTMNAERHPSDDALVDFVLGALDASALGELERHVSACDACAAKLAREAELELALPEIARAATNVARPRRWVRAVPVAAALAAAAVVAIVLMRHATNAEASGPIPDVICADGPEQDACIADAH